MNAKTDALKTNENNKFIDDDSDNVAVNTVVSNPREFLIEVNKGNVPGHFLWHKFGWSEVIGTTFNHVWNQPAAADLVWQTVASRYDIVSTDITDNFNGVGARSIRLIGLDANFNEVTEDLDLHPVDGTIIVTSANEFIRLNRAYILTCGSYSSNNNGLISVSVTGGGDPQGYINAGEGQTEKSQFTIRFLGGVI